MVVTVATPAERTSTRPVLDRDLVYVTGKGGAGKTTVAAALRFAAAVAGRHAIVCEVGGAQTLAGSISVDPRDALTEWIRRQRGGVLAAALLSRSPAFAHFVEAAPGAKELLTIGKIVDLQRTGDCDVVIVDGPSTGHALGMLAAPRTVDHVASRGPIAAQAHELHEWLADANRTAYVGVSLPEEMSVHELLDLEAGLQRAVGRGLDLVVVNGVYPDRFSNDEADQLRALAEHDPASGPLQAALYEHRQARRHAARTRWLRERVAAPLVTLPFVFDTEVGFEAYERLARRLRRSDEI